MFKTATAPSGQGTCGLHGVSKIIKFISVFRHSFDIADSMPKIRVRGGGSIIIFFNRSKVERLFPEIYTGYGSGLPKFSLECLDTDNFAYFHFNCPMD